MANVEPNPIDGGGVSGPFDLASSGEALRAFGFDLPPDAWMERVEIALLENREADHSPVGGEEAAGQHVGPYELLEKIGTGGMGAVWRARRADKRPDRIVALKLIRRGTHSRSAEQRFRLEEQVLSRLSHPHIATLFDCGVSSSGRPYLIMEYVEGESLLEYAVRLDLSIEQRLGLFQKVCSAVQYAHGALVLHRDIKPSNILVTAEGTVKLLDFGIAKLLDDDAAAGMTATDVRLLTPRYASPEQVQGLRLTTASDQYSLGVVLFELLTGRSPYRLETGSRAEIERAVLEQEVRRPSTATFAEPGTPIHRSDLSRLRGDLDTIVVKTLQKDPLRRYASVGHLATDMERYLSGLPISAAPDSLTYRASRFVKRNKGLVAGLTAAMLALGVGTIVSTTYALRESQARAEAERRTLMAEAVNAFLNEDVLASVDPRNTRNPNLTMREALARAAERIEERFGDQPLVEATIRETIGETYLGLRLPQEAVPHFRRAFHLRWATLGQLDAVTRKSMRDLVTAIFESDDPDGDGAAMGKKLLELDIEAAGSNSADAMDTRHLLGRFGGLDSDLETSLAALRTVLEWNRAERGVSHPETLSVMHTLANQYIYHKRLNEALPFIEEAYQVVSDHYESSSPETLDAMLGLAILYGRIDRNEEAILLLKEAVQILRETRPPLFADTGIWLTHLGIHLKELERIDEAEAAFLEAYSILSATLGPEAGWTQGTVRFLGELYEKSGDADQADIWRRRLLPQYEKG